MVSISKKNLNSIYELDFHDAGVKEILCNYDEHTIEMPVKLDSPSKKDIKAKLTFENVIYADISFYEPWGRGKYINELSVNNEIDMLSRLNDCHSSNICFHAGILLNSGDTINIICEKIIYIEV